MKIHFRRFNCVVVILTIMVGILFPGGDFVYAGKKTKITVSLTNSEYVMKDYIDEFEKRNPDIEVEYSTTDNYDESMGQKIKAGKAPDVFFVPDAIAYEEYKKYLAPLGSFEELSEEYNYISEAKNADGILYGLPSDAYIPGFVYNKEVFDKAGVSGVPASIDEFMDALRSIKENTDAIPFYTNYNLDWVLGNWETFTYFEMTGDADYKMNKFPFEKNPYKMESSHGKVYSLLSSIVQEGLCEENLGEYEWDDELVKLNEGEIGCVCAGSWAINQFKTRCGNGENIGFMPFPNKVDGKFHATIVMDYGYGVNAKSKNIDAAKKFVEFMLSESGYAVDHDVISIHKTDPLPDCYTQIDNLELSSNSQAKGEKGYAYGQLQANLILTDGVEQKRIMDAASGKSDEVLEEILEDWNRRWESSRTEDIPVEQYDSYGSKDNILQENYKLELTDLEKTYVKGVDELCVGYVAGNAPYCFMERNTINGVAISILDYITEETGLKFIFDEYNSEEELIAAVKNDKVDIIASIVKEPELEADISFSKVFIESNKVAVKNDTQSLDSEEKQSVAYVGNSESKMNYNPGKNVICDTIEEAFSKVNNSDAAVYFTDFYSANYYVRTNNYPNVEIIPVTGKNQMCFGFSKDVDSKLISVVNKSIYAISDAKIQGSLIDCMDTPAESLTINKIIKLYPIQSMTCVAIVIFLVFLVILLIVMHRSREIKIQAIEAERYKILAELSNEFMFEYDSARKKLRLEDKLSCEFGFVKEIFIDDLNSLNNNERLFVSAFLTILHGDDVNTAEFFLNDGESTHWYKLICHKITDDKGTLIQIIGKMTDIQEEVEERNSIISKAEKDILTGILNREGFNNELKNAFSNDKVASKYAYGILDLDDFKGVNDFLGHAGGDEALKILAEEIEDCFSEIGFVGRYGGDEFIIFIKDATDREFIDSKCMEILDRMDREFEFNGKVLPISISMGMVIAQRKIKLHDAFLGADACLYEIKQAGKNNYILKNYTAV